MRNMITLPAALLALASLGACNNKDDSFNQTIGDPMENQLAHAAPVELPPPLKSSKTYRCKDNSLVYIDLFADELGANLRTEKEGKATKLVAAKKGDPFEATGGYKIEGDGSTLTVTLPGKSAQACKG